MCVYVVATSVHGAYDGYFLDTDIKNICSISSSIIVILYQEVGLYGKYKQYGYRKIGIIPVYLILLIVHCWII